MPIRRTSNRSSYDSGFYNPEIYSDVGSRFPDPFFSNVVLLLRMDGSNGSTVFTDLSPNPVSVTASSDARVTTTFSKFGEGSVIIDTASDRLLTAASSNFNLSSGDFTVELWLYKFSDKLATVISQGAYFWRIQAAPNGTLSWVVNISGQGFGSNAALPINEWSHVAVAKSGSLQTMYFNGTAVGSGTLAPTSSNTAISIGNNPDALSTWFINGCLDEVRVTKGVARYTSNFTPPVGPFPAY